MALYAYLQLKGQKTGQVTGSVTQKGREGRILVEAVSHEVLTPRDPATGMASGKRIHKPITVQKPLDRSSPVLYQMLVNNETITQWELQFWTPQIKAAGGTGAEVQHYTVRLTNAHIVDIRFSHNAIDAVLGKLAEQEEVSFTYQRIEWIWVDGGITAFDDVNAPG